MTDEQHSPVPQPEPESPIPDETTPTTPLSTDRWSVWFYRLVQAVGLGMVIAQQATLKSDKWLLIAALGMMSGGLGVQILVRTVGRAVGGQQ